MALPLSKPPPYAPGDALTVTYRGLRGVTERPARYVGPYPHGPLPSCVVEYDDGTAGAVFLRDVRAALETP